MKRYDKSNSIAFLKTRDKWGELSNMASGYPINIHGIEISGTEALYQAMRLTEYPAKQTEILTNPSPFMSKREVEKYKHLTRQDWMSIRSEVMKWVVMLKVATYWEHFSELLKSTGGLPIVEISKHDDYWGAFIIGDELVGNNELGELWMEVRDLVFEKGQGAFEVIYAPRVPGFKINGRFVSDISVEQRKLQSDDNEEQFSLF